MDKVIDYGTYYYRECSCCGRYEKVWKNDNPKLLCGLCLEWDTEVADLQTRLTAETKARKEAEAKLDRMRAYAKSDPDETYIKILDEAKP